MRYSPCRIARLTAAALALAIAGACDNPTPATAPSLHASMGHSASMSSAPMTAEIRNDVAELRARTAAFHRFETAAEAGWGVRITDCFSDPSLGGMGYHYGNPALIDGVVDAAQPELLLYEPQKNGRLRFVAVEYVVPFTAWTATEPPKLYGQFFHRNEVFGLWVLHVWHMSENPSGIFTDWNPKVSCRYAS